MKKTEVTRDDLLRSFYAAPDDALFSQAVIAAVRDCSEATLERDRWAGGGIPFVKIGRMVKYRKSDMLAWLEDKMSQTSTSQIRAVVKAEIPISK